MKYEYHFFQKNSVSKWTKMIQFYRIVPDYQNGYTQIFQYGRFLFGPAAGCLLLDIQCINVIIVSFVGIFSESKILILMKIKFFCVKLIYFDQCMNLFFLSVFQNILSIKLCIFFIGLWQLLDKGYLTSSVRDVSDNESDFTEWFTISKFFMQSLPWICLHTIGTQFFQRQNQGVSFNVIRNTNISNNKSTYT